MDYEEAVRSLNTSQRDAIVVAQMERIKIDPGFRIQIIKKLLQVTGLTVEDLDKLNIIHVTGTKGKGSTCAFIERILRNHGLKTGFFSSPQLVQIRERVRINGQPISKDLFANFYWKIYKQLDAAKNADGGYFPEAFQMFLLIAFHVFLQEKVDVVILEVGIGGEYDNTNVIRKPWVCGITSLGIDHVNQLGNTIEKIAWHKAGIFKPGVPAFTVSQPSSAMNVVQDRAEEIGCPVWVCPDLDDYEALSGPLCLGLAGEYQRLNAALALQLCNTFLQRHQAEMEGDGVYSTPTANNERGSKAEVFQLSSEMVEGLQETRWLGRSQIVRHGPLTYYVDGAHTVESIEACVDWFKQKTMQDNKTRNDPGIRVLLFNTSGERDSKVLLEILLSCKFDYAVFCPKIIAETPAREFFCGCGEPLAFEVYLKTCVRNQMNWQSVSGEESSSKVFPYILDALHWISQGRDPVLGSEAPANGCVPLQPADDAKVLKEAQHITVLVTGSLYLVGGVLECLDPSLTA